jgi:hypothetical protein
VLAQIFRHNENTNTQIFSRNIMLFKQLTLIAVVLFSQASFAGLISWENAKSVSDDNDIITTGTLFDSVAAVDTTVNGVQFNGQNSHSANVSTYANSDIRFLNHTGTGNWGGNYGPLSSEYHALLSRHGYTSAGQGPMIIEINSLIIGNEYLVQLWAPTWDDTYESTYDSSVLLTSGSNNRDRNLAQYIVGRFTATDAQQLITATTNQHTIAPALQVRGIGAAIQVPEPSTLAIFALGVIGLASRRFKKQS